jgi:hypothetical protein
MKEKASKKEEEESINTKLSLNVFVDELLTCRGKG